PDDCGGPGRGSRSHVDGLGPLQRGQGSPDPDQPESSVRPTVRHRPGSGTDPGAVGADPDPGRLAADRPQSAAPVGSGPAAGSECQQVCAGTVQLGGCCCCGSAFFWVDGDSTATITAADRVAADHDYKRAAA